MNYSNSIHQVSIFVFISLIFSISTNVFRSDSIDYMSKGFDKVESLDDLNLNNEEGIKEVSLKIAQDLFEKKTLFIDARAKEYYLEAVKIDRYCTPSSSNVMGGANMEV